MFSRLLQQLREVMDLEAIFPGFLALLLAVVVPFPDIRAIPGKGPLPDHLQLPFGIPYSWLRWCVLPGIMLIFQPLIFTRCWDRCWNEEGRRAKTFWSLVLAHEFVYLCMLVVAAGVVSVVY